MYCRFFFWQPFVLAVSTHYALIKLGESEEPHLLACFQKMLIQFFWSKEFFFKSEIIRFNAGANTYIICTFNRSNDHSLNSSCVCKEASSAPKKKIQIKSTYLSVLTSLLILTAIHQGVTGEGTWPSVWLVLMGVSSTSMLDRFISLTRARHNLQTGTNDRLA